MTELSRLEALTSCESTQDELWRRWDELGERAPEALYTLDQRSGRGRLGRRWLAPAGACLCLSWRAPAAELAPNELWALSFVGGLALAELTRSLGAPCQLKWPNDLLWRGRKLAGVLCEARLPASSALSTAQAPPRVVMGIGLNLRPLPGRFEGSVSLEERLNSLAPLPDPLSLSEALLSQLRAASELLARQGSEALIEAWRRDSLPAGTRLHTAGIEGSLRRVTAQGSLLLDTPEGVVSIESGEAELIK